MSDPGPDGAALQLENAQLRREVELLREQLALQERRGGGGDVRAAVAAPACSASGRRGPPLPEALTSGRHALSKYQVERYSRHLLLHSFGLDGQARLCAASALVVGCGGLGSPAALYLAAAGVGERRGAARNGRHVHQDPYRMYGIMRGAM